MNIFETNFGTQETNQRINSLISDNKSFIIEFGTVCDYLWENVVQNDSEIYLWLKDSEAYDKLDSAEQAVITDTLYDFLKENYDYKLVGDSN